MSDESNGSATAVATDVTTESVSIQDNSQQSSVTPNILNETSSDFNFIEHVSQDLHGNLDKFKSVNDLAKSYVNLEKKLGTSINLPAEGATDETRKAFIDKIKDLPEVLIKPTTEDELNAFYNKLGRPENKDSYEIDSLIPRELIDNDAFAVQEINEFKEMAHKLGLTKEQDQGLVEMRMEHFKQDQQDNEKSLEQGLTTLNKLWGTDFDTRKSAAIQMKDHFKDKFPEHMESLLANNESNPALAHMLSELAFTYQEKCMICTPIVDFGETPDSAKSKIVSNQTDKEFMEAYLTSSHPGHNKALEEMKKLYRIGYETEI